MGGGLMQLVAYGAQDVYLTGNPQITFWKVTYRRHTNFSLESVEQTFNGQADFGRRVTCTISRNGDLAYRTYLQVTLPEINQDMHNARRSGNANAKGWDTTQQYDERINDAVYARWLDCPGEQIISQVEVEIGGQRIDRQYGDWMHIWQQLTLSAEQERGYNKMIGNTTQLTFITDPTFADVEGPCDSNTPDAVCAPRNALPETTLYVPLQFWYCRNPGLALPLIALQYHEVKINLDLRPIDECLWAVQTLNCSGCPDGHVWDAASQQCVPSSTTQKPHDGVGRYQPGENVKVTTAYNQSLVAASLYVDYVFLDTDERRRMAQNPHEYLIEQLQFTGDESVGSSSNKIKLNFNHPCKELIWVVQPDSNVDYCSSLECGATLFSALGAQPFNYSDSLDALPNALHAFSGPRSAANNSDPNVSPHWSFIGKDGLFAQAGAADNNPVATNVGQFWNVSNASNENGVAENNILGGGAYGSAGGAVPGPLGAGTGDPRNTQSSTWQGSTGWFDASQGDACNNVFNFTLNDPGASMALDGLNIGLGQPAANLPANATVNKLAAMLKNLTGGPNPMGQSKIAAAEALLAQAQHVAATEDPVVSQFAAQVANQVLSFLNQNGGMNAPAANPAMTPGANNSGGGFYDGGVGPVSFVSDAGAFVLNETSLTMHCWGENPVVTAKLQLNGQDRFSEREGTYFDLVQPYQHHTRSPDTGINVYSFALRPEEHQPSGTCNFSRIDNATLQLVLSNNTVEGTKTAKVRVYATNYNVLRIMSGMGGLAYSN